MAEFLANMPLQGLLALAIVPIGASIILVGGFFFYSTRRSRKAKMKHGIQPNTSAVAGSFSPGGVDANTNILSNALSSPRLSKEQSTYGTEDDLDLGILSKRVDTEVARMATSKSSNQESVDLAARLGNLPSSTSPPAQFSEPVELLRLLRDPQSGQLIVEVAGQRYTKLVDITDKRIGQYILKLTAHLLAFTNGVIVTDAGMKSVYTPKVGQAPRPILASTPVSQPPAKTSTLSSTPPQTQSDTSEPVPVPKPSPEAEAKLLASLKASQVQPEPKSQKRGLLGRVTTPSPPAPTMPGLNLAEEINDIVQARLRYSPLEATTQIDITADPSGGIRIEVNGQFYTSPDDISDPAVKDLIKDSIKEWERS